MSDNYGEDVLSQDGASTFTAVEEQVLPPTKPKKRHPSVLLEIERRSSDIQLLLADKITAFAGSMSFVYMHIALFWVWMVHMEATPWPTLTLAVSLEAIFLSTFVMIGQNRQAAFQQAKADHDYAASDKLLTENTELTKTIDQLLMENMELTRTIHTLTMEMHSHILQSVTEKDTRKTKRVSSDD